MLKNFFKDTAVYGLASVLPRLINFGLVALITSVFSATAFSTQTIWYVFAAFINVILTLGLETAFFRFYTSEKDKNAVISTSFLLLLLSSGIFLLLGLCFSEKLTQIFGFQANIFEKLLIWTTFFDTLAVIPFAYLRVTGRPVRFMVIKLVNVLSLVVFMVFFLLLIPYLLKSGSGIPVLLGVKSDFVPDVLHIFISNVAASFITLLLLAPEIFQIKWIWDKHLVKRLLNYGIPIMIGGVAYVVNENADKLILSGIDENANGIYAACYKLGVFMTLYITAFRMGAEPFFFNHAGTSDAKEKYSRIMTWFVIFGSIFMLGVVVFIDVFAGIFLRQDVYLSGLMIVPVILLANLFSGIYNNLAIWYKLTDRTRFGMLISILGAILTIVTLYIFIPIMGIMGAALSTLLTYFMMAFLSWYLGQKYYPVPYEIPKILLVIGVSTTFCALSYFYFREQYIVGILLLICYTAFIWILEKNELKLIFQKK